MVTRLFLIDGSKSIVINIESQPNIEPFSTSLEQLAANVLQMATQTQDFICNNNY